MFKLTYLIIFILLSSCITQNKNTLTYQSLREMKISSATKEDIINKFGQPNEIDNRDGTDQALIYNDKETKYQRASIYINTTTNLLDRYMWIPIEGEKESKLDGATSSFGQTSFIELPDIYSLPCHISSIARIRDEKNGISIMYNKNTKDVDAIGYSGNQERSTSSQ